ncbi:MAG: AI-2E family transporter, partial [Enterococcus sp.]|nr:AI-2E family transporter [Enterococcus sp.]
MKKIQANWNEWIVRFLFIMLVIIGYKLIANYQEIYTAI